MNIKTVSNQVAAVIAAGGNSGPLDGIGTNPGDLLLDPDPPGFDPNPTAPPAPAVNEPVRSMTSVTAFHSTLFENFGLRAIPHYNFFEEDEKTNTQQDQNVRVGLLARHVELVWNVAPVLSPNFDRVPTKGVRAGLKDDAIPLTNVEGAAGSAANGFVGPGAVSALVIAPAINAGGFEFHEDAFLSAPSAAGLDAAAIPLTPVAIHYDAAPIIIPPARVQVTFVDPSIAGALHENRIMIAESHVQLAALGSVGQIISGLEVLSEFNQDTPPTNPPPAVDAPVLTPTLVYVGYLIEKYQLGPSGGMTLVRQIFIDDPLLDYYEDREVAFEGTYSYRMRVVVQWSHPNDVGFSGISDLNRERAFDPSASASSKKASFYLGDWSEWATAQVLDDRLPDPPDELIVRPVSRKGLIDIVWKMPFDPQHDIKSVKLLRAVDVGGKVGPWQELGEFPARNGRYIDRDVSPYETTDHSYVYAMFSTSFHDEHSVLSEQVQARTKVPTKGRYELPLKQVAERGGDPFGSPISWRPPTRDVQVIAQNNATFYVRPSKGPYPLFDRSYLVELQSLSTGERMTLSLSVDSTDIDGPGQIQSLRDRADRPTNLVTRREGERGIQR